MSIVFRINRFIEALLSLIFCKWFKKNNEKQDKKCEPPNISTYPILRNLIFFRNNVQYSESFIGCFLNQIIAGYAMVNLKEKMAKTSWGGSDFFMLFYPETAEVVLKSNNAINKNWIYSFYRAFMGNGLITSTNDTWRIRRKLLNPAFHFKILEKFQSLFTEKSNILIKILKNKKENEVLDINKIISSCALDIIAESTMGICIDAQGTSESFYEDSLNRVVTCTSSWTMKPWYWIPVIFNFSAIGKIFKKNIEFLHNFTRKVIRERKEKLQNIDSYFIENNDIMERKNARPIIDLLLYHHLKDSILCEDDVSDEIHTLMDAGHETTTLGISWTLYLLGLHKDIQNRVFEELEGIFGDDFDREITTEDLRQMKYLEQVIKESHRIYPPVPVIMRKNETEMKIGEYVIPPKSSLMICIYAIHHNPTVFPNPEVFDPDRFSPENRQKIHPFSFIPFSAGPRNCIGHRFAMMEMKTILCDILRHFTVHSLDPRDKIYECVEITLRSKFGIRMTIKERRKSY